LVTSGGLSPWDKIFQTFIFLVIISNVVLFIISTEDDIYNAHQSLLNGLDLASVIIFTIEYVLRVWSCLERKKYAKKGPFRGRISFMLTPISIIDLAAILPYWIQIPLPEKYRGIYFLSAVRFLRIFRLFKAEKYTRAVSVFVVVIKNNREVLLLTAFLGIVLFICTSSALYFAERGHSSQFTSIPNSMYAALLMLTAQEVPRAADLTVAGQVVVAISAVFSVGVFAVPAGIIGWGFESVGEKFQRHREDLKKKKEIQRLLAKPSNEISSSSDDSEAFSLGISDPEDENLENEVICPTCHRALDLPASQSEH